jgi:transcriptional regulator with XRE-family HTH domain
MDDGLPQPPPEAELIRERRGEVSIRAAARQAGISESMWRLVERGRRFERELQDKPYEGSAVMIAKMARAVGVTPAELAATGRPNAIAAAGILRRGAEGKEQGPELAEVLAQLAEIERDPSLTRSQKQELYAEVVAAMGEYRGQ